MDCLTEILGVCPVCSNQHQGNSVNKEKIKITSIAEVNGEVVVTFDNGIYYSADLSVVDKHLPDALKTKEEIRLLTERVEALENKEDKDTIFDPTELNNKISELEDKLSKLTDNIIDIEGLDGEVSHLAINKSYKD